MLLGDKLGTLKVFIWHLGVNFRRLGGRFLASGGRFWTHIVDGVDFWNSGSRFWAPKRQFPGNGIRFLACGRRLLALVVEFFAYGSRIGDSRSLY